MQVYIAHVLGSYLERFFISTFFFCSCWQAYWANNKGSQHLYNKRQRFNRIKLTAPFLSPSLSLSDRNSEKTTSQGILRLRKKSRRAQGFHAQFECEEQMALKYIHLHVLMRPGMQVTRTHRSQTQFDATSLMFLYLFNALSIALWLFSHHLPDLLTIPENKVFLKPVMLQLESLLFTLPFARPPGYKDCRTLWRSPACLTGTSHWCWPFCCS